MESASREPAGPEPADLLVLRALGRSRATVLFRLVLLVPHAVVLFVLGVVAIPVAVGGFLGALVLGRLPGWARGYLAGVGRWNIRYQAYAWLLTDRWPPFSFAETDYPVAVVVPPPTRLNRLAVLARIPLAPVGYVAYALAGGGLGLFVVFAWFAGVFAGRTPRAVYDALATALRYQWRIFAYLSLLVPTFPWGWLGDGPALPTPPPGYPAYPGYPTYPGYPGYSSYPGQPAWGEPVTGPNPTPTAYPPPVGPVPTSPPTSPPTPPPGPAPAPVAPPFPAPAFLPATTPDAQGRAEPTWYRGLISSGSRAILIIGIVLGGLNLLQNAIVYAHGYPHVITIARVDAARTELDDAVAACTEGCSTADILDRSADLRRRVADGRSEGGRRQAVLADLDNLDAALRDAGPRIDGGSAAVDDAVAAVDHDVDRYVAALGGGAFHS